MEEIAALTHALQQQSPAIPFTTEPDRLRAYTVDGLQPRLVITPTTVETVAQAVALSCQHKLTVLPRGGGSHMNVGGLPERVDVLIETTELTRVLEHEAPDLTCHVEAGITLAALQKLLATKGQKLALDPPGAEQATIGGLLAVNASGPKRLRYGTARDLVIGLRVVQANGDVAHSGGRVVKNVAGYDLNKLYIGSLGTLGVIVEANFKLHPLPGAEQTLLLTYTRVEDALQTVTMLLRSNLAPTALEVIDARAASDMADFFGFDLPVNGYTLAVNFEGSAAVIGRQIDDTRALARTHHALLADDLAGAVQDRFWHAVREHTQGTLTCKVALPVAEIVAYIQYIDQVCQRLDLEAAVVAHAGNGILFVELRPSDATERIIAAISELRTRAQEVRGSLVVERCPVELKRRISVWGEPGANVVLMQRLKEQFDPTGTFVRGRFFGGL